MSDQNQNEADKAKNKLGDAVDKIDDALRERLDWLDAPSTEEIKLTAKGKLRKVRNYVIDNARPLAVGAATAVSAIVAITAYNNRNRDLLKLPHKTLDRLTSEPSTEGAMAGAEYIVKGKALWLIPAQVPPGHHSLKYLN